MKLSSPIFTAKENTRDALKDWSLWFKYEDGKLYRIKTTSNRVKIGDLAGGPLADGRWVINFYGKNYYNHRVIYELHFGEIPVGFVIDHIDGCNTNNRIENLRLATPQENMSNMRMHKDNTSGFRGVSWSKGKWIAKIRHANIYYELGRFATKEDASLAYLNAEKELKGEFARG